MDDLLPLILFVIGCAAVVTLVFRIRRVRDRATARRLGLVAIVVGLGFSYATDLAYRMTMGDPDVWDFYGAYRYVPVVVLTGMSLFAVLSAWLRPASAAG